MSNNFSRGIFINTVRNEMALSSEYIVRSSTDTGLALEVSDIGMYKIESSFESSNFRLDHPTTYQDNVASIVQ